MGQTVTVTLKDQFGNPASCWADQVQVPCEVSLYVPAGTWVGSDESSWVNGPATVKAFTKLVDYSAAGPGEGAGQAAVTYFGIEGTFDVWARGGDQDVVSADGVRAPNNQRAVAHIRFTDSTAPSKPVVDPSDGKHVSGRVDEADVEEAGGEGGLDVVVKDQDGKEIARCPVKADGTFDCPIVPKQPDGTDLVVVIEDPAGNQTDPPVEIKTDGVAPTKPVVDPSRGGSVTGRVDDGAGGAECVRQVDVVELSSDERQLVRDIAAEVERVRKAVQVAQRGTADLV